MLRLKKLAEEHGLSAKGVEVTPQELHRVQMPAIAHIQGRTFVAVVGYSDKGFKVVFPYEHPHVCFDAGRDRDPDDSTFAERRAWSRAD